MLPNDEQAHAFATMLLAGLPASVAILYFTESEDPQEISALCRKWERSRKVGAAIREMEGAAWETLSTEEMLSRSIDQHYRQLATMLKLNNYIEASQIEKSKMDSARQAIEAKLAGVAGKADPLSQFFADLKSGAIKLPTQIKAH